MFTLAKAKAAENSAQRQLKKSVVLALGADSIENGVIAVFKQQFSALKEEDNSYILAYRATILDSIEQLAAKHPEASASPGTPTCPLALGGGNGQIFTMPPAQSNDKEEKALDFSSNSAFSAYQNGGANGAEPTTDKLAFPVPKPNPVPKQNKDKLLDSLALKIQEQLRKFEEDLNGYDRDSGKLDKKAHKEKVSEMHALMLKNLKPLFENNSKENLDNFKTNFEKMLADKKSSFKATPWIWHDVIKPALMGLLGILVSILTLPARPFKSSVGDYANSFFVKPDSKAFVALKQEADDLMKVVERSATATGV